MRRQFGNCEKYVQRTQTINANILFIGILTGLKKERKKLSAYRCGTIKKRGTMCNLEKEKLSWITALKLTHVHTLYLQRAKRIRKRGIPSGLSLFGV